MRISLLFLFMMLSCIVFSQDTIQINELIKQSINAKRERKQGTNAEQLVELSKNHKQFLITKLIKYRNDSNLNVQRFVLLMFEEVGLKSKKKDERIEAVKQIIQMSFNSDAGIAYEALEILKEFDKSDFDDKAKQTFLNKLNKNQHHLKERVKICGWIGDGEEFITKLKNLQSDTTLNNSLRNWTINLALTRLSDTQSRDNIFKTLRQLEVNNPFVLHIVPDLLYSKDKEIYNFLILHLDCDKKNCVSPNPDNNSDICCGYAIMEQLAQHIKKFPFKVDRSGMLITDDYNKALEDTKVWFAKKKQRYQIITETY